MYKYLKFANILNLYYLKYLKITILIVFGTIEDEHTFNTFASMKSILWNRLYTHMPCVAGMHSQRFSTLESLLYNLAYEDW